ncbi:hypothetical protein [Flavihumibacter sp. CACIAM 22H1]|uniref:hypothetical protein n=1 Tax=Flavihumibacter sp. CACIAM 22H1 TaxID=1812911 RepID=UPI0007A7ED98|nr:hypothetical protein [Flavihumibacter sp. CACIAM 22H1]KYP16089.1 MAG: hypothetical protein A1D16_18660 [Flavihumibacter sp. CACIAM 22H1]
MAFKLFRNQSIASVAVFAASYLLGNPSFSQSVQDYSILKKKSLTETVSWSMPFQPAEEVLNNYDHALRDKTPVSLNTYLPDQYAGMPAGSIADKRANRQEIVLRSRKGTELFRLKADQLITLQALLLGKVHDPVFFAQVVVKDQADAGTIEMNRSLVRQLLALALNRSRQGNELLNDFRLEFGNWLVTQQLKPAQQGNTAYLSPCGAGEDNRIVYSWKFPSSLKEVLGADNTVEALNDLAVEVLAGNQTLSKHQLNDLYTAVRIVNEAFENGRFLLGWSHQFITCSNSWILRWKLLTPVPELPVDEKSYTTRAKLVSGQGQRFLEVTANQDSKVLIELYSEKGSRLEKYYHSQLSAGNTVRFEIKAEEQNERLVYKVTADGRTYSGLIPYLQDPIE